ncbi:MAG: outer membrane protein assembly factor BamB family protein [Myxococcales bacterium]
MKRLALSLLPVLAVLGCILLPPTHDWFAEGLQDYQHNVLGQAYAEFNRVPPTDGRYQRAQFYLGAVLARQGQVEQALSQMQHARDLDRSAFDQDQSMPRELGLLYATSVKGWSLKEESRVVGIWPGGTALLTLDDHGVLTAVDPRSQTVLWEKPLGSHASGKLPEPRVDGDTVYVIAKEPRFQQQLVALALEDGSERWSVPLGSYSELSTVAVDRSYVYAGSNDGKGSRGPGALNAFQKATGKPAFSLPTDSLPEQVVAASDYICTQTNGNRIYCAKPGQRFKKSWSYEASGSLAGNLMTGGQGKLFFAVRGDLYALNLGAAPGVRPLAWKAPVAATWISAPTFVDGAVVVQAADTLRAYDAGTGKGLWVVSRPKGLGMNGRSNVPVRAPSLIGGLVVGRSTEGLFAVPRNGGELAWFVGTGREEMTSAAVAGDGLVVATHGQLLSLAPRPWTNVASR